jgi:5-(carboxyamino)imidazole ribonucleotide synthase
MRTYPVVDNLHEDGILVATRVPADLAPAAARGAAALARSVIEALDVVGVACVELFLMADGSLFVNEVAPRPHNSGHYTLDASATSQFEQQVRALCGLPLGDVRLLSPAVMLNLIGETFTRAIQPEGVETILRTPGAALHVYGKREVRPRRKMGHVTVRRERPDDAWEAAMALRRALTPGDYARPRG